MSLKTKFIILVVGVIFVPLLFMASIIFLQVEWGFPKTVFDRRVGTLFQIMETQEKIGRGEQYDLGDWAGFQVEFDTDGTVIKSNHPDYAEGDFTGDRNFGSLLTEIADSGDVSFYHVEKNNHLLVQFFPDQILGFDSYQGFKVMQVPVILSGLFVALMSLLMIRSINSLVRDLSTAMDRVANGDLDFSFTSNSMGSLGTLGKSFESMRQKIQEESRRKVRFLMGVSHDLKTPLSSIKGYSEAMLDGFASDPKDQKEYLKIILDKSSVLEARISQLLDFVKMDTQQWKRTFKSYDVVQECHSLWEKYRKEFQAQGLELDYKQTGFDNFDLKMDKELFTRCIENLLENARLYGDGTSPVSLQLDVWEDNMAISVKNQGRGIPQDDQEMVFEPFYRGDPSRNSAGTGLGLSSVKSIIEAHGWEIQVKSHPGNYTEFRILIQNP